ncbi:MAG: CPBP family intramembrane metalloprotease [Candidatus Omnitrophica bacterium]|nr:CPBP family intramembrane metalloprotease [Candidatus Omnitrophota bacterium]
MDWRIAFYKVRAFVIRERLYAWLLVFIVAVNAALIFSDRPQPREKAPKGFSQLFEKKFHTREELSALAREDKRTAALLSLFGFSALFAILLGLFFDVIILILKKERAVLLFPTLLHERPPGWGIWDVCKVGILFLWFGYVLEIMGASMGGVLPALKDANLRSLLNATATNILAFLFIMYFAARQYNERPVSLGLSLKGFVKNFFYGAAAYVASIPALLLVLGAVIWVSSLIKYEPPLQPVLEIFFEEKRGALIAYLTVFVAVFGPITEELFFRGFMYRAVRTKWGFKTAVLLSSALFALLHASPAGFFPIFILGMLLAYLFERTGTLVAPCAVHILHNTAMIAMVFIIKGILIK